MNLRKVAYDEISVVWENEIGCSVLNSVWNVGYVNILGLPKELGILSFKADEWRIRQELYEGGREFKVKFYKTWFDRFDIELLTRQPDFVPWLSGHL